MKLWPNRFNAKDKQVVSFQMHTWCPFGRSSATSLSPTIAPTMVRQALRNKETEICSPFHTITFCFCKLKMNPYVRSNVASRLFFTLLSRPLWVQLLAWHEASHLQCLIPTWYLTKDFSWDSTCRPEISAMVVPTWFPLSWGFGGHHESWILKATWNFRNRASWLVDLARFDKQPMADDIMSRGSCGLRKGGALIG